MPQGMEQRYTESLNRYVTAMRNGKPDKVPIRPFVAEFAGKYAGYDCQQVSHDYNMAFDAAIKCAADFDWDAVVPNMVYVWTGLAHALGLKYYGIPGIHVPADTAFQYLEPPHDQAFMRADEYDALIADPTAFLFNTWLPRVSTEVAGPGDANTTRNNLALVKGGMAMLNYFMSFGPQIERLRTETGTVSAIAGMFKAPLDIIGDKLRGYLGLTMDLLEQPDKVLEACKALMPHLMWVALSGCDPDKNVPIGFWMHRGCVPFVTTEQFNTIYWPTLKPIIETIWEQGNQTLFYAEGDWNAHLDAFAELPDGSITYHVDHADIFEVNRVLGKKFCISGGIPNTLLSYGTPDELRDCCKKVIDEVAADGGYVMDASAIVQVDAKVENMRVLTEFTREYGVYSGTPDPVPDLPATPPPTEPVPAATGNKPGVIMPWEAKRPDTPPITGDEQIVSDIWEANEALAYTFIYHCLLSF